VFIGLFSGNGMSMVVIERTFIVLLEGLGLIDCDLFRPVCMLSRAIGTNIFVFEFQFTVGRYECRLIVHFLYIFFDNNGFNILVNFVLACFGVG